MIISSRKDGKRKRSEHVISATGRAWSRTCRRGAKSEKVVIEGGRSGESSLICQELRG
jgi:hypothetical protein